MSITAHRYDGVSVVLSSENICETVRFTIERTTCLKDTRGDLLAVRGKEKASRAPSESAKSVLFFGEKRHEEQRAFATSTRRCSVIEQIVTRNRRSMLKRKKWSPKYL